MFVSCMHTASKMWLLGRLLSAMIGDKIPDDDRHWINLLLLLKITDYVFAPAISKEECHF